MDGVRDRFDDGAAGADFDALGIVEGEAGDLLELRRHGGGEEQRLPFCGAEFHDGLNIVDETHVEHAVHFIEDERLDAIKFDERAVEKLAETAGGGDDDVGAGSEGVALRAVADAAVEDGGFEIGKTAEVAEGGFDLDGEFAGRFEDEDARAFGAVRAEAVEHGQGKRSGLAGSGRRGGDEVAAGEDSGNGAQLDGRGIGVAASLRPANEAGIQSKF